MPSVRARLCCRAAALLLLLHILLETDLALASKNGGHIEANDPNLAQIAWDDWTDGCIAVANEAMDAIWNAVDDGTVIVIRP